MVHKTEPQVFIIGESRINRTELWAYLEAIGAQGWTTDASDDISEIIEVDGRGCYLSFGTELNENISRVREGNDKYIRNLINVQHGSVIEHGFINFQIINVSRVFTHELVRHRVGTAISQESLRFVRASDLGYWIPPCLEDIPSIEDVFYNHWVNCEDVYENILSLAGEKEYRKRDDGSVDANKEGLIAYFNSLPFDIKKKYTSAARRFLPIGMATKIGWSCNIRTLRAVLEMRTHPSSEEEMRLVFGMIGNIALKHWPTLFKDYETEEVDGLPYFNTEHNKV